MFKKFNRSAIITNRRIVNWQIHEINFLIERKKRSSKIALLGFT
jgi:hypothetical protein